MTLLVALVLVMRTRALYLKKAFAPIVTMEIGFTFRRIQVEFFHGAKNVVVFLKIKIQANQVERIRLLNQA